MITAYVYANQRKGVTSLRQGDELKLVHDFPISPDSMSDEAILQQVVAHDGPEVGPLLGDVISIARKQPMGETTVVSYSLEASQWVRTSGSVRNPGPYEPASGIWLEPKLMDEHLTFMHGKLERCLTMMRLMKHLSIDSKRGDHHQMLTQPVLMGLLQPLANEIKQLVHKHTLSETPSILRKQAHYVAAHIEDAILEVSPDLSMHHVQDALNEIKRVQLLSRRTYGVVQAIAA